MPFSSGFAAVANPPRLADSQLKLVFPHLIELARMWSLGRFSGREDLPNKAIKNVGRIAGYGPLLRKQLKNKELSAWPGECTTSHREDHRNDEQHGK
jgi:hypothetical protein